jgi:hypothetical protein
MAGCLNGLGNSRSKSICRGSRGSRAKSLSRGLIQLVVCRRFSSRFLGVDGVMISLKHVVVDPIFHVRTCVVRAEVPFVVGLISVNSSGTSPSEYRYRSPRSACDAVTACTPCRHDCSACSSRSARRRESRLGILVQVLHVGMRGRAVEVEIVFLTVFAVIGLAVRQAEHTFFEDGIFAIRQT